jgi:hypothetical protein
VIEICTTANEKREFRSSFDVEVDKYRDVFSRIERPNYSARWLAQRGLKICNVIAIAKGSESLQPGGEKKREWPRNSVGIRQAEKLHA